MDLYNTTNNNIPILTSQQKYIRDYFLKHKELKLHLGCGRKTLAGYLNVDLTQTGYGIVNDNVSDMKVIEKTLHLFRAHMTGKISEVISFHLFEHLPRVNSGHEKGSDKCLEYWNRLLMPGGKLVMELPDFRQVICEYIAGNAKRLDNIFGLNRFAGDKHQFGYTPEYLKELVESKGFKVTYQGPGTDYHCDFEPCQRLEAVKI